MMCGSWLAVSMGATAAPMTFGDWSVICDNLRHCEAVGYMIASPGEEGDQGNAGLLIRRDAGPGAVPQMNLSVRPPEGAPYPERFHVRAGKVSIDTDAHADRISPALAARLLPALLDVSAVEVSGPGFAIKVPLHGLKAALLKIDDLQGRVGSESALIRKGERPESAVPPPPASPAVRLAVLPADHQGDAARFEQLQASLAKSRPGGDACWEPAGTAAASAGDSAMRLSDRTLLVLHQAPSSSPYNFDWCAWIVQDHAPWKTNEVVFADRPPGEPDVNFGGEVTVSSREVSGGSVAILSANWYGSSQRDCGSYAEWAWTGSAFALIHFSATDVCIGLPGGLPIRRWHRNTIPPLPP